MIGILSTFLIALTFTCAATMMCVLLNFTPRQLSLAFMCLQSNLTSLLRTFCKGLHAFAKHAMIKNCCSSFCRVNWPQANQKHHRLWLWYSEINPKRCWISKSQNLQKTSITGTPFHQLSLQTSQTFYTPLTFVAYNIQSLFQNCTLHLNFCSTFTALAAACYEC